MGGMIYVNATYDEHVALVLVDLMESHDIPQVQEAKDLPELVHAQDLQSIYSHFSQLLYDANAVGFLRRTSPRGDQACIPDHGGQLPRWKVGAAQ